MQSASSCTRQQYIVQLPTAEGSTKSLVIDNVVHSSQACKCTNKRCETSLCDSGRSVQSTGSLTLCGDLICAALRRLSGAFSLTNELDPSTGLEEQVGARKRLLDSWEDGIVTEEYNKQQPKRQKLMQHLYLVHEGRPLNNTDLLPTQTASENHVATTTTTSIYPSTSIPSPSILYFTLGTRILGGMDRQNRVGSKFGGGGVSSAQHSERERKERLKKLALESIDLAKDPYLVRNHLGSYECKLCLTLHRDEANYLAHTQGKKHQHGLARRAHLDKLIQEREGKTAAPAPAPTRIERTIKIGRPAYQVFKSRDPKTNQRCLSFEVVYPEIEENLQPRHRFMSSFEQRVERPPEKGRKPLYQYLLFAADPYETIAFKIPNDPIDKKQDRFVTHWDDESKKFTLTLYFIDEVATDTGASATATTTIKVEAGHKK
jgi:splicing factor 3A subunit 2